MFDQLTLNSEHTSKSLRGHARWMREEADRLVKNAGQAAHDLLRRADDYEAFATVAETISPPAPDNPPPAVPAAAGATTTVPAEMHP